MTKMKYRHLTLLLPHDRHMHLVTFCLASDAYIHTYIPFDNLKHKYNTWDKKKNPKKHY